MEYVGYGWGYINFADDETVDEFMSKREGGIAVDFNMPLEREILHDSGAKHARR